MHSFEDRHLVTGEDLGWGHETEISTTGMPQSHRYSAFILSARETIPQRHGSPRSFAISSLERNRNFLPQSLRLVRRSLAGSCNSYMYRSTAMAESNKDRSLKEGVE
jgi:hypothetical protein